MSNAPPGGSASTSATSNDSPGTPRWAARLVDHRRVDVHADHAALRPDGLGDAARDRAGAASDVEHRQPGAQQRREASVSRRKRAGVENRAGALGHVRAAPGRITPGGSSAVGDPPTIGYHGAA